MIQNKKVHRDENSISCFWLSFVVFAVVVFSIVFVAVVFAPIPDVASILRINRNTLNVKAP